MLIVIMMVVALSTVALVGVGDLSSTGSVSACSLSRDAAKVGSSIYFTTSNVYPTTFLQMTSADSPSLHLAAGVTVDDEGTNASGRGWTLTMTPGVGGLAPSFTCVAGGAVAETTPTTAPESTPTSSYAI